MLRAYSVSMETDHALDSLFGRIFYGKPVSTSPENAPLVRARRLMSRYWGRNLARVDRVGEGNALSMSFGFSSHNLVGEWRSAFDQPAAHTGALSEARNNENWRPRMTRFLQLLLIGLLAALGAVPTAAQNYPGKAIRVIVSTSPGGVTDIAARILGAHIPAKTGQPDVIDNRPGASGNIAMEAVARA